MLGIILSNIMKFFVPLCLFIWALFMPHTAGYTYIAIYGLFSGYLLIIDKTKPNPDLEKWSTEEIEIINKYGSSPNLVVILSLPGLTGQSMRRDLWIPAFAGMTR